MSGLLVVLPIVEETPVAVGCVESLLREDSAAGFDPSEILVVDNTRDGLATANDQWRGLRVYRDPDGHNIGCARAWNIGVQEVLDRGLDYLVILSASVMFGPILHTTWRRQMETFWGERVIEAEGLSWKLIAFHRTVFERVGGFAPGYWPAYFEALDQSLKMRMVGWEGAWTRAWVNAVAQTVASHAHLSKADPLLHLYSDRWGGPKGDEIYSLPYGDKPLDFAYDEPIPVLAERYGYGPRFSDWW